MTGQHTDTEPYTHTVTAKDSLEMSCVWILGGSQSSQREPAHAWGEHASSIPWAGNGSRNLLAVPPYREVDTGKSSSLEYNQL